MKNKKTLFEEPIIIETFKTFGSYEQISMTKNEPSCFNGVVNIRKYRITIEPIEETNSVLAERLQKMWDECNNSHHWNPIKSAANEIGYELKGSPGNKKS